MIAVGNDNKKIKNKDMWNHFHHMPMLSLLGVNHCLPLFHMAKCFIWINEAKQCIYEFTIGYMINSCFNVNKYFIEQMEKCMYTCRFPCSQNCETRNFFAQIMPETIDWLESQSTRVPDICPSTDGKPIWIESYSTRVTSVCPSTNAETIQLES